jgi:hypothetical protein
MSIQELALTYLRRHPGIGIHVDEIDRALGFTPGQATSALCRLLERHPDCGVIRLRKGVYSYQDPLPGQPPLTLTPELDVTDAVTAAAATHESPEPTPLGSLYEVVSADKHGFPIVQSEDGGREMVLVRRTFVSTLMETAKDREHIETIKTSLQALVGASTKA